MEGDGVYVGIPWEEVKVKQKIFLVWLFSDIFQVKKANMNIAQ